MSNKTPVVVGMILLAALAVRAAIFWAYGPQLSLNSDDAGYMKSAVTLLKTGILSYHRPDEPTVHIMPGMPMLLAFWFYWFGFGAAGIAAAKWFQILLGVATVYGVYQIGKTVWNAAAGAAAALLAAVYLPLAVADNLLLTETPFTFSLVYACLFSLLLARRPGWPYFWGVLGCYLLGLYLRPTIALFPLCLLVYLLLSRYPLRLLVRQAAVAALVAAAVLAPWWIRNYMDYHRFIPLTGGLGNPLLLGTYQGIGYPQAEPLDRLIARLDQSAPRPDAYTRMLLQEQAAKQRMREWWRRDKGSFLYSYAVLKPAIMWRQPFYPIEVLHVHRPRLKQLHPFLVLAGAAGLIASFFSRRFRNDAAFLALVIIYFTYFHSMTFAYERYALPLMPLIFLGAAGGALGWLGPRVRVKQEMEGSR